MSDLVKAIRLLKPTAQFSFYVENYSTIKWDVIEGTAPSQKEIETALIEVKKQEEAEIKKMESDKAELLAKLGINAEEVKLLLS